ncbi:hypothetical protein MAM1_0008d00934 [Mucor ambiguus]|uniref:Uncharacterized protein n=1 Tax=Mucor ambiguus TaxID=91626 RepID=A0A0C9M0D2_9FUNG|nr:hypothetical protein MAM1_0008d00934 [Mucor ambiguus]
MTAYQIPTENEQLLQWSKVELQQQHQQHQPECSRKRVRTFEQDESDDSATPPEKTLRLHESIEDGRLYNADQWRHLTNTSREIVIEHDEQNCGKIVDVSKLSTKEILSAYKRIWNNLDLSKPTDAKLEPFVWHQIRQYQQRL